ncbi:GNAT family N-acetyltransferase [Agrococcus terreus]|uniref:GNAT family N-acetyltransferase n=1 Tax=Agrococcus terreus TaxID=574649 RepID=UPI00384C008F
MTAHVREATIGDAAGIARVRVETWRAAYAGLVPQAMLDRMDIQREAERRAELWDEHHDHPHKHELVAVADGEVVGWAAFGPAREALPGVPAELYAIYALSERWSRGVGHALLTESERRLVADGHPAAYLWRLEGNDRAARFYEAHGWAHDGGRKVDGDLCELRHLRRFDA